MSVTVITDCEDVVITHEENGGLAITYKNKTGIDDCVYVNTECCTMIEEGHILIESSRYAVANDTTAEEIKAE